MRKYWIFIVIVLSSINFGCDSVVTTYPKVSKENILYVVQQMENFQKITFYAPINAIYAEALSPAYDDVYPKLGEPVLGGIIKSDNREIRHIVCFKRNDGKDAVVLFNNNYPPEIICQAIWK